MANVFLSPRSVLLHVDFILGPHLVDPDGGWPAAPRPRVVQVRDRGEEHTASCQLPSQHRIYSDRTNSGSKPSLKAILNGPLSHMPERRGTVGVQRGCGALFPEQGCVGAQRDPQDEASTG